MKQYLAIIKRDYGASGGETFWLPAPIYSLIIVVLITWLFASSSGSFPAWQFLALSILGAYRILDDLSLSRGHSFGFLAPDFHTYQFNYSTSLVFISSVLTCAIFANSFYEFFVCLSILWLITSSMFFFVRKEIWRLTGFIGLGIYILIWFLMIYVKQNEYFFSLWQKIVTNVWSIFSIPAIGITISCVCLAITYKSFLLARSNYLKPAEYDPNLAPRTWKKHRKSSNFTPLQLFANAKRSSKTWGKIESRVLFGLDIGRHEDLLYLGLFGAKVHSYLLKCIFGFLVILFALPLFFVNEINHEAILIPICIFMLFYLVVVCTAISLEWINNRKSISDLWLLDNSKNRRRYMLKVAMLFAERIGRVSLFACAAFILFALIISGVKGGLIIGLVALLAVALGLLLQMTYVLFVITGVKNTAWLRYVTVLFTAFNFIGWLAVVLFSLQQKQSWILALAIVVAAGLCFTSIKFWCGYAKELRA